MQRCLWNGREHFDVCGHVRGLDGAVRAVRAAMLWSAPKQGGRWNWFAAEGRGIARQY